MGRFDQVFDSAVGSTLRPGAPGTARLARDWGDRLVSVRYRYSDSPPTRFTTVELVVAAGPWKPSKSRQVLVDVKSWEPELRAKVQAAGGRWVPDAMRWQMRHDRATALGLGERMSFLVPHASKTSTDVGTRKSLPVQNRARFRRKRS
jgi:hypothetical protein